MLEKLHNAFKGIKNLKTSYILLHDTISLHHEARHTT